VPLANTVVTSLLLAYIYEATRLLAGAVLVPVFPITILLPIGILWTLVGTALSVTGFKLAKAVVSRTSLRVAYVINGFPLAFHLLIILGLAALWLLFSAGSIFKVSDMH
jgi:hypothetical protein